VAVFPKFIGRVRRPATCALKCCQWANCAAWEVKAKLYLNSKRNVENACTLYPKLGTPRVVRWIVLNIE
jgi:hypothetical protein